MKIIFDYNRTLFNPETDSLYPGVIAMLENVSLKHALFLVSKNELGRKEAFDELGVAKYFQEVHFVNSKTIQLFQELSKGATDVLVVGDRVAGEIHLGNQLGFNTIWVRQGKFSDELPTPEQQPTHAIRDIRELESIIATYG